MAKNTRARASCRPLAGKRCQHEQMDRARELLEAERQQTLQRLAALTCDFNDMVAASRDSNADDEHDPEGATIAFERSQVNALVLLVQGHYGICEACGQPIGDSRLEVRPAARTCISCASAASAATP